MLMKKTQLFNVKTEIPLLPFEQNGTNLQTINEMLFLIDSFLKKNTNQILITITYMLPDLGGLPKLKHLELRG